MTGSNDKGVARGRLPDEMPRPRAGEIRGAEPAWCWVDELDPTALALLGLDHGAEGGDRTAAYVIAGFNRRMQFSARGRLRDEAPLPRAGEVGGERGAASAPAVEARAATQRPVTPAETRALALPRGAGIQDRLNTQARSTLSAPLTQPFTAPSLKVLIAELKECGEIARRLPPPSARDPEQFHCQRDELGKRLIAIAEYLERRL